jgi:hypothetical protein
LSGYTHFCSDKFGIFVFFQHFFTGSVMMGEVEAKKVSFFRGDQAEKSDLGPVLAHTHTHTHNINSAV